MTGIIYNKCKIWDLLICECDPRGHEHDCKDYKVALNNVTMVCLNNVLYKRTVHTQYSL